MDVAQFQLRISDTYLSRDRERGAARTFAWLVEEVGELSRALRHTDRVNLDEEFADVLAWLVSVANLVDVDLDAVAAARYGSGCPKCGATPCVCPVR